MRAGLLTSTYLDAMGVTQLKQSYQQHAMDQELQERMFVSIYPSAHLTRLMTTPGLEWTRLLTDGRSAA